MSSFNESITLKNARDVGNVLYGIIKPENIRQVTVEAVVDTGASTLFITEEVCRQLGLAIEEESYANIADGSRKVCKKTEAVKIHWANRNAVCAALVIQGAQKNLFGAMPLEMMDLRVNPVKRCLEGVNGNEPLYMAL